MTPAAWLLLGLLVGFCLRGRRRPQPTLLLPIDTVRPLPPASARAIDNDRRVNRLFIPVARPSAPLIAERDAFDEDTFS